LLPLLTHHDRQAFEIVCYNAALNSDWMSEQLKAQAHAWRDAAHLDDRQLAQQIRQDRIDILVDLSLHTGGNRLLTFAQKPAPVQVTYLAYCSTSGMDAMDYRLTDPHLDPPHFEDGRYSERSVHLPQTYWCFDPPADSPAVGPLPAQSNGYVTFGCLNQFKKVSPFILGVWIDLLRAIPRSRLILHAYEGPHRQRLRERFIHAGIEEQRLDWVGFLPMADYLNQYNRIDIALDSFPFAGGTTTCDALWMGVPVVTLTGNTAVSRGAASVLANVGLNEFIGSSRESWLAIATSLADDIDRLAQLRSTMRQRMRASALMDAPAFAHDVESAFRMMWGA
jgi:protein O-GlcNAc transferase